MEEKQNKNENMEQAVMSLLSSDSRARMSNIRLANPQQYAETIQQILTLYNRGYIQPPLAEQELVAILKQLNNKREINIRRR